MAANEGKRRARTPIPGERFRLFARWSRVMPELPEVETVVAALGKTLAGKTLAGARSISGLRRVFPAKTIAARLAGRRVTDVRRRAKYIVIDFDAPFSLLAHLGMTGYFHMEAAESPLEKHDRAVLLFGGGEELRFADARRFGFVDLAELPGSGEWPAEFAALGVEPLGRAFTGRALRAVAENRKCPVKVFIMDQRIVVGVGNIYASEALHLAGIDPRRAAGSLSPGEWDGLAKAIKAILRKAVRKGGSTIRNYRTVDGSEGLFQRHLRIYGKADDVCPVCGGPVHVTRQAGRSTFFCPECQR